LLEAHDQQASQPLSALAPGQAAILRCIVNESVPLLDYLAEMGLRPGTPVTLCAAAPFDGPLTVEVAGERFALARSMADHLLVDIEEAQR
jgi:DtxR family Mn-dependent transcriptional regulator